MGITNEELEKIIQDGENERVEFKIKAIPPNYLSKYIVAFSNAEGGTIYFGIDEKSGIVGCDKELLTRYYDLVMNRIQGDIKTSLQFEYIDNNVIGVLTIEKSKTLVSSNEGVFIRSSDKLRVMKPEEIQSFLSLDTEGEQLKKITELVSIQTETIDTLNKKIENLEESINGGNKISNKIKDYVVGGIVGALISIVLGAIF